jgi:sulfhydrogenase subunit delta
MAKPQPAQIPQKGSGTAKPQPPQISKIADVKEISMPAQQKSLPPADSAQKRLRIGFFSFTGCEGCMIEFLEVLNTKYFDWAPKIDVVYSRLLREKTNKMSDMDVAFIEGGISSFTEEERLKEIRSKAKYMVAIGSCAISGAPNNYRNYFDEQTRKEIEPVLKRFKHREKVSGISEIVKVDAIVPGCPILDSKFIEVMEKYMKEFGVIP